MYLTSGTLGTLGNLGAQAQVLQTLYVDTTETHMERLVMGRLVL